MNIHGSQHGTAESVTGTRRSTKRNARHHRAKLTAEQVRKIRSEYLAFVVSYETLAKRHGCGISTVRDICSFYTWRHVI